MAGDERAGLLVFRSLTKTWALAGLRAGYALGAPELLARLAAPRPPWPVSTPAIEAVLACSEPAAVAEADRAALRIAELAPAPGSPRWPRCRGSPCCRGGRPTCCSGCRPGRGSGCARRCARAASRSGAGDTFPGLGPDHMRVAVRAPAQVERLAAALSDALAGGRRVMPRGPARP